MSGPPTESIPLFVVSCPPCLGFQDKENKYLETCFGPVKDEITGECEVEGVIPPAVRGEFARMAPNPRFTPKGGYHWFDGDGMVST